MLFLICVDNLTCFSLWIKALTGVAETASHKEPVPLVGKLLSANANQNLKKKKK